MHPIKGMQQDVVHQFTFIKINGNCDNISSIMLFYVIYKLRYVTYNFITWCISSKNLNYGYDNFLSGTNAFLIDFVI